MRVPKAKSGMSPKYNKNRNLEVGRRSFGTRRGIKILVEVLVGPLAIDWQNRNIPLDPPRRGKGGGKPPLVNSQ